MVTVYGIRNCGTCRKAWRWLDEQGIAYRFVDLRRDGLEAARVADWAARVGTDALVNRRGQTWRRLSDADRARDEAGLRALLCEQPALVKRPVIECADGTVRVGWNETVRGALGG